MGVGSAHIGAVGRTSPREEGSAQRIVPHRGDRPPCGHSGCGYAASETGRPDSGPEPVSRSPAMSAVWRCRPSARHQGGARIHQEASELRVSRITIASMYEKPLCVNKYTPWRAMEPSSPKVAKSRNVGSLVVSVSPGVRLLAPNVSRKLCLFAGSGATVCKPLQLGCASLWKVPRRDVLLPLTYTGHLVVSRRSRLVADMVRHVLERPPALGARMLDSRHRQISHNGFGHDSACVLPGKVVYCNS